MTQYSKSALARHTRLALLAATLGLAACGGGNDSGDTTNPPPAGGPMGDAAITTEQAQTAARTASRSFSNAWNAVSGVVSDSPATDVALDATGLSDVSMLLGLNGNVQPQSTARHADEPHPDTGGAGGSAPPADGGTGAGGNTGGGTGTGTGVDTGTDPNTGTDPTGGTVSDGDTTGADPTAGTAGGDTPTSNDGGTSAGADPLDDGGAGSPANGSAESDTQLDAAFDAFLSSPTRDGNTLTYRPDVDIACADETIAEVMAEVGNAQSQAEVQELCRTLLPNVTVVQTLDSETSGTLTYRYRETAPFLVGYSPNSAYFEVQLEETRAALVAMAQDVDQPLQEGDLPSTFTGALRLTATETGTNAGSIRLSVPESIAITGATDLGEANFSLDATEKLIEIGGDDTAGTAYVEMDVGAISATLPDEDAEGTPHLWELASAALTGRIDVDNNQQRLTITNLGFGDEPTTVRIDGQEALRVALDNFSATVDGNAGVMTFGTAVNFTMSVANAFGLMDDFFPSATDPSDPTLTGEVSINAPAGTALTVLNPDDTNPVTKVTAGGPIEMQGTGEYDGSVSLPSDSCFVENNSSVIPLAPVQCP